MSDTNQGPELPNLPSAIAHSSRRWAPQIIWIIPIIAVVVGLGLMYKAVVDHGPTITIAFKTGDGITAGKTFLKYKDVNIGLVKTVELSEDHQQVIAKIKWILDDAIRRCPVYGPEQEWLREQEKQRVIRILKDE